MSTILASTEAVSFKSIHNMFFTLLPFSEQSDHQLQIAIDYQKQMATGYKQQLDEVTAEVGPDHARETIASLNRAIKRCLENIDIIEAEASKRNITLK